MEKLLIAVHSDMFADALAAAFRKDYDIRTCTDGIEALALLNTFQPDALILFLRLPRMDGITLLSHSAHSPKIIIGILDAHSPYIERQAEILGIGYLMVMPTVSSITVRLTQMRLEYKATPKDPKLETVLLLHALGVNVKLDGWDMLCVGIPLFLTNPKQTFTKELYPAIAALVGASDGRAVEHAIRDCITKAWKRRDHYVWMKYFPLDKDANIPCPSNSCFIKTLGRFISD